MSLSTAVQHTERWHDLPGRPVRSVVLGDQRAAVPEVVVVPGLGALGYLVPTALACAAWTRVHLLDLPGFGSRRTARLPADLASVSSTTVEWLDRVPSGPVLLMGHSTGAQAALHAAAARPRAVHRLVLAGITFPRSARRPARLLLPVVRTLRHERAGEVPAALPYYWRGASALPSLLRSSLADRPEDTVGAVVPPVLVLRGRHDRLCPQDWAQELAGRARAGTVLTLPGAHNHPWTHPEATARALFDAAGVDEDGGALRP